MSVIAPGAPPPITGTPPTLAPPTSAEPYSGIPEPVATPTSGQSSSVPITYVGQPVRTSWLDSWSLSARKMLGTALGAAVGGGLGFVIGGPVGGLIGAAGGAFLLNNLIGTLQQF